MRGLAGLAAVLQDLGPYGPLGSSDVCPGVGARAGWRVSPCRSHGRPCCPQGQPKALCGEHTGILASVTVGSHALRGPH